MARPFDSNNYVGQTASAPCSPAAQFVVVVGGSYQGCYADQTAAQNAYNQITGSLDSGATASSGATPGNGAGTTKGINVSGGIDPSTNGGLMTFITKNWLTLGIVGGAAYLLLGRRR